MTKNNNHFSGKGIYLIVHKMSHLLLVVIVLSWGIPVFAMADGSQLSSEKSVKSHYSKSINSMANPINNPPMLIGPGDLLTIMVYDEDELPTDYQVDSTGVIVFPYVGEIKLADMTPAQASEKLAIRLQKPRKVTILIKESNTYWVSVMGNVVKPGKYQIHGAPSLLSALAEAGGPLPDSDLGSAILIHHDVKSKLNLNSYLDDDGRVNIEPYLYPGDVLMIKKSEWPSVAEWAIIASILSSIAVVTVEIQNLK